MAKINTLHIAGLYDIFLSSHPIENVRENERKRAILKFIDTLKRKEIRTVVVLLPSHEIKHLYGEINLLELYKNGGLEVIHFPLENFSVPDKIERFHACITVIVEKLHQHSILIHCIAGCGRTGMMAAGVLVKTGWNATDAIEKVRQSRPGSMDVLRQILFLRSYQRFLQDRA